MTSDSAKELCRLAEREGRPVDAYRYFLEISEDGILSDNFCCDGDYGGTVQYTDLLDCPALAGEENYNAYGEWNYAYPDRVMTLQEREDGLVLTFHGFGIHCRDNSRGVYGDEIDYDKGESLDMYVDSVFISAAEAEKNLVPCEDGGYAFFLLPAKGRYRYECRDLTARMEIGLLLKKDRNGWSIVSDEPQENDLYEKVWTKLEGFVLQNYPACDAELLWPGTLPESTARPEIQDFVRDLQNCIWLAAREKYRLCPDRWERLLEEHWEEWTGMIRGTCDRIANSDIKENLP